MHHEVPEQLSQRLFTTAEDTRPLFFVFWRQDRGHCRHVPNGGGCHLTKYDTPASSSRRRHGSLAVPIQRKRTFECILTRTCAPILPAHRYYQRTASTRRTDACRNAPHYVSIPRPPSDTWVMAAVGITRWECLWSNNSPPTLSNNLNNNTASPWPPAHGAAQS